MATKKFNYTQVQLLKGLKDGSINLATDKGAMELIDHMIEGLSKKSTNKAVDKKTTAITSAILEVLSTGKEMRVTDIALADERLSIANGVSPQKISYIVNHHEGISKRVDKKVSYFSLKA